MKSTELRQKRAKVIADARAILDKAAAESRALTDEERGNYDAALRDAENIRETYERMERQAAIDAELDESRRQPPTEDRGGRGSEERETEESRTRREAFGRFIQHGRSALSADEVRALSQSNPVDGGFLVAPQEFRGSLIQAIDDAVFMRQLGTVLTVTTAASLGSPSLDTDVDDADWTSELATGSEGTIAFGRRELSPHPLAKRVKVSKKLLRSSATPPEGIVRQRLAYKFGVAMEKGYMLGSGASRPLGIFVASADGIPTGRDVQTGSATDITMDGLIGAKYALKSGYHARARWLFHRDGVAKIAKIREGSGTGQYLWQPSTQAGQPDRLLGFPVLMSEFVPNTFTSALYVGMLADFSHYWIVDALDLQIQRLDELYAETNQVGFIGRAESDGMPVLAEAFVRLKTN